MKRAHELIIFDWDGTLMDSAAKIVRCFENALADTGIPSPGETAIRHIIGLGLTEAVTALLPDRDIVTRTRAVDRYREHFLHLDQTDSELFPGVQAGLEDLANRGYLLAVATGKSRRGLERVLQQTGLAERFVATRCADEAFSKPHPRMLHDILERTGMEARQALMVGDTVYDLEMARNAGMASLAVTYGVHGPELLEPCGPLACLGSFAEVHRWLA
jgi:phosphoglycolate phosphatase